MIGSSCRKSIKNRLIGVIIFLTLISPFFLIGKQAKAQKSNLNISKDAVQGEILYVTVEDINIESAIGYLQERKIPFFRINNNSFGALVGIDMGVKPDNYILTLELKDKVGTVRKKEYTLNIASGSFGTQVLTLPQEMVELDEKTLARVKKEQAIIDKVWEGDTMNRLWEGGFLLPVKGDIAGTFGQNRILNGEPRNPHSGEDIKAPEGTEVLATNEGIVRLVEDFFFSGKSIFIDHGLGLYSMYFHLSRVDVMEGERVKKGQVIGLVGQSGRATGPHLHWGIRLNGAKVNPLSLINLSLE